MTPKPDTSPANIARVLRDAADRIPSRGDSNPKAGTCSALIQDARALADALDQHAAAVSASMRGAPADETGPYGYCDCGTPLSRPTCRFCDNDD